MKLFVLFFLTICTHTIWSQTSVTFNLKAPKNSKFKYVGIRGEQPPLNWEKSYALEKSENGYTTTITFSEDIKYLTYKYVLYNSAKKFEWEPMSNRTLKLSGKSEITVNHSWGTPEKVDITKLEKIPSKELLQDFEIIKTMVLDVHPGTYRYASKQRISERLDELKEKFQKDLSHAEAYLAISKVLATIQCDHTFASFYNQPPVVKEIIHNQKDKFPFTFSWIDNKMVVIKDASGKLERGTQINTINDISTGEVLKQLMPYIQADGATDKSRKKQLEISGYPYRYNAFDVFYPLVFGSKDSFSIDVTSPDGIQNTLILRTMTRDERAEKLKEQYKDFAFAKEQLWGYKKLENTIGYLRAGTFDDFGMDRNWRNYFSKTFKEINKSGVEHLIVDLRENQGGFDEIGQGLIEHLIKKSGTIENYTSKSRYKDFPDVLKPYAKSWGDPWFHKLEVVSDRDKAGYYLLPEENSGLIKPAKNAFKGNVYFLISPANVSMAYYLASAIKKYKIGTLIGEETGGNQRGINGGQILFLRLPNSQIEIDFPVEGSFSKNANAPNKGIEPDLEVIPSIDDINKGIDTAVFKVIEFIKK